MSLMKNILGLNQPNGKAFNIDTEKNGGIMKRKYDSIAKTIIYAKWWVLALFAVCSYVLIRFVVPLFYAKIEQESLLAGSVAFMFAALAMMSFIRDAVDNKGKWLSPEYNKLIITGVYLFLILCAFAEALGIVLYKLDTNTYSCFKWLVDGSVLGRIVIISTLVVGVFLSMIRMVSGLAIVGVVPMLLYNILGLKNDGSEEPVFSIFVILLYFILLYIMMRVFLPGR